MAPIVRCVPKNMAHKSVQRLPSYGLTCQMILESLTVAQAQLCNGLAEGNGFMTIQTDGTTKYGEHFTTYDIQVESVTYSLGLRHVFSGSSCDTLETLKQILSDIDSHWDSKLFLQKSFLKSKTPCLTAILLKSCSMKCFMTTEQKFFQM